MEKQQGSNPEQISKKSYKKLNWDVIERVDIEKVRRQNDIESIESFFAQIQFGRIKKNEYPAVTEHNKKTFLELSQMTLQYLDHTQMYQINLLSTINNEDEEIQNQIELLEKQLRRSKESLKKKKTKLKIEKGQISKLDKLITGKNIFACYFCTQKHFDSIDHLMQHNRLRHEEQFPKSQQQQTENLLAVQTILLQQQVNAMVSAQQQQNIQFNEIQLKAQFTELNIKDDIDSSSILYYQIKGSSDGQISGEDEIFYNEALELFKIEQKQKDQALQQKIQQLEQKMSQEQINYTKPQMLNSSFKSQMQMQDKDILKAKIQQLQGQVHDSQSSKQDISKNQYDPSMSKSLSIEKDLKSQKISKDASLYSQNIENYNQKTVELSSFHKQKIYSQEDDQLEEELVEEHYSELENNLVDAYFESQNEAQHLNEEKQLFTVIQQAKKNIKDQELDPKIKQEFLQKKFHDEYNKSFQKLHSFTSQNIVQKSNEELEQILFRLKKMTIDTQKIQKLAKIQTPVASPLIQKQGTISTIIQEQQIYSIAQEIKEIEEQKKINSRITQSIVDLHQKDHTTLPQPKPTIFSKQQNQLVVDQPPQNQIYANPVPKTQQKLKKEISFDEFSNSEEQKSPLKFREEQQSTNQLPHKKIEIQKPIQNLNLKSNQNTIKQNIQPKKEIKNFQFKYEDSLEELDEIDNKRDHQGEESNSF